MTKQLLIRAIFPGSPVWVYLAKDTWNRKHDGSVYYWSNNMMIASVVFESEAAAMKKIARLKIKDKVRQIEVTPLVKDVQIVYLTEEEMVTSYR